MTGIQSALVEMNRNMAKQNRLLEGVMDELVKSRSGVAQDAEVEEDDIE